MRFKKYKEILAIKNNNEFGFRLVCNLSPEEMRKRKEEVIRNILEKLDFEWDIEFDREGQTPTPCKDLNGFWSYFVKFN